MFTLFDIKSANDFLVFIARPAVEPHRIFLRIQVHPLPWTIIPDRYRPIAFQVGINHALVRADDCIPSKFITEISISVRHSVPLFLKKKKKDARIKNKLFFIVTVYNLYTHITYDNFDNISCDTINVVIKQRVVIT